MYAADSSLGKVWRIADNGQRPLLRRRRRRHRHRLGARRAVGLRARQLADRQARPRRLPDGLPGHAGRVPGRHRARLRRALWFTELRGNAIGRLTTDGQLTEYPLPTPDAFLADITAGPDGALWFTESSGNKIGRITTAGAITEYALPTPTACRPAITAGPDGALWFAELNAQQDRPHDHGRRAHARAPDPSREREPDQHRRRPRRRPLLSRSTRDGSIARMALDGTVTKRYRLPSGSPDGLGVGARRRPLVHAGQPRPGRPHRPALGSADRRRRHDVRHEALGVRRAHGGDVHRRRPRALATTSRSSGATARRRPAGSGAPRTASRSAAATPTTRPSPTTSRSRSRRPASRRHRRSSAR